MNADRVPSPPQRWRVHIANRNQQYLLRNVFLIAPGYRWPIHFVHLITRTKSEHVRDSDLISDFMMRASLHRPPAKGVPLPMGATDNDPSSLITPDGSTKAGRT
jgi:hypothetical protein